MQHQRQRIIFASTGIEERLFLLEYLAICSQLPNRHVDVDVEWHTIFMLEGVMIYLDDGVPSSLLNITSSVLRENKLEGSLCFADRLENVPGGDFDLGVKELKNNGWEMKDWCPKPGLARHMGSANLLSTSIKPPL